MSHLTPQQQQKLQKPGVTSLAVHNIQLKDFTPVQQRMYRVPERLLLGGATADAKALGD